MKRTISIFILLSICARLSTAQIELSASLKEAVEIAIEKNIELQNKYIEAEKIELEKKSVWNKYIPRLDASANYIYLNSHITIDIPTGSLPILNTPIFDGKTTFKNHGNLFVGALTAKTILFSGLQIENGAKALEQKQLGTTYLAEAETDNLVKDVIHSFDQLQLLNETEKLIVNSEKRLQTETNRVNRAIEEGLAIPYDRDKIKLADLELKSKKSEIEGKKNLLYHKINYLTGYTDAQIENVENKLSPYMLSDTLTIENKPELKALESFKKAADFVVKKEKGTYLPVMGAVAGLSYISLFDTRFISPEIGDRNVRIHTKLNELTLSPSWMVGVSMQWEIFDGMERKHKIHEAKLSAKQVENKLEDTREKLALLLDNNLTTYKIQTEKYQIGIEQEKVADHNLQMAVRQYQEGLINISQRLEAENDKIKASTNLVKSLVEQRNAALEALSVTGELTQIVLK